jgi:hypothetical protein
VWKQVLKQIGPTIAATLEKAEIPAISGPNLLAIRFSASYTPFCKRFQNSDGSQRVAEVLQTLTGQKWTVRAESAETQTPAQSPAGEGSGGGQGTAGPPGHGSAQGRI